MNEKGFLKVGASISIYQTRFGFFGPARGLYSRSLGALGGGTGRHIRR